MLCEAVGTLNVTGFVFRNLRLLDLYGFRVPVMTEAEAKSWPSAVL